MWKVPVELLCDQHLLGEHLEMHMFVGTARKGYSLDGYIRKGLVETDHVQERHNQLAEEMKRRGMAHKSPLKCHTHNPRGKINIERNIRELKKRCARCRKRIALQETCNRQSDKHES